MREIGVHDDYEGPRGELKSIDVGSTQAEFACARFEDYATSVEALELLSYLQGAIRRAIVNNNNFPVEFTNGARALVYCMRKTPSRGLVEIGRTSFSVKVRLRSQVTMQACVRMETRQKEDEYELWY